MNVKKGDLFCFGKNGPASLIRANIRGQMGVEMKHSLWLVLSGLILLNSADAMADEATDDLRCYVVSVQMLSTTNTAVQMAAMMAHGYWLGKVDGLIPQQELEDRVIAEFSNLSNPDVFKAEATRCGLEMMARGKAEADMGKDMTARGQKMMEQQNTR